MAALMAAAVAAMADPAGAQAQVAPVAAVQGNGLQCLLGGVADGRLVDPESAAKGMRGGERYTLFGVTGRAGQATGTRPASAPDDVCQDMQALELSPLPPGAPLVAVGGAAARLPAKLEPLGTTQPVYRQAMADLLRAEGIDKPELRLTRVIRTDFEGDGTDEVILEATRHAGGAGAAPAEGDYSVIAVRRLVGGQVRTQVLAKEIHAPAGEFGTPTSYVVVGVVDLDGDGVAELVTQDQYYEGVFYHAYRLGRDGFTEALTCGCGV